jgi:hypothetical protein
VTEKLPANSPDEKFVSFEYKQSKLWIAFATNFGLMVACLYILKTRYLADTETFFMNGWNIALIVAVMATIFGAFQYCSKLIHEGAAVEITPDLIRYHSWLSMKSVERNNIIEIRQVEKSTGVE